MSHVLRGAAEAEVFLDENDDAAEEAQKDESGCDGEGEEACRRARK